MISKFTAGVLHENHKALIARGPWRFEALVPARYESRPTEGGGTCEVPVCAGACDICGQGICDVAFPDGLCEALKGCEVEFTATLTRSDRDEHFAFAAKPSKARLVAWPAEKAKPSEDVDCAA